MSPQQHLRKGGSIVRQVVGYDRLIGERAYRQLTELYRALRLYVNCFQPRVLLQAKQRDGKKVRYVYDPAKTPREPVAPVRRPACPEAARADRGGTGARPHSPLSTTGAVASGRVPLWHSHQVESKKALDLVSTCERAKEQHPPGSRFEKLRIPKK
jgi:hypothetical protein